MTLAVLLQEPRLRCTKPRPHAKVAEVPSTGSPESTATSPPLPSAAGEVSEQRRGRQRPSSQPLAGSQSREVSQTGGQEKQIIFFFFCYNSLSSTSFLAQRNFGSVLQRPPDPGAKDLVCKQHAKDADLPPGEGGPGRRRHHMQAVANEEGMLAQVKAAEVARQPAAVLKQGEHLRKKYYNEVIAFFACLYGSLHLVLTHLQTLSLQRSSAPQSSSPWHPFSQLPNGEKYSSV